jgi:hypothetical protein
MMMTSQKRKGGQRNHRKKMIDLMMIEEIVLIGLIQGSSQGMEGMIEI